MKKYSILFFYILFCLQTSISTAQMYGFSLADGKKAVDIPFEFAGNLIVLPLRLNHILPLRFILDTGAQNTILLKKEYIDMLHIPHGRSIRIMGADRTFSLDAFLVYDLSFDMMPYLTAQNQAAIVLEENLLDLETSTGEQIDGILGADIFKRFIIKINYDKKILSLYEREKFQLPKNFTDSPISIIEDRPYIQSAALFPSGSKYPLQLLIDTGANFGLLLHEDCIDSLDRPTKVVRGSIGKALGNNLEGYLGRIQKLGIASFEFSEVVTIFQKIDANRDSLILSQRQGLLGAGILRRFEIIFDYIEEKMYWKPNRYYKKKFSFDKSGLVLIATGVQLKNFLIQDVLPYSPAFLADLKKNDRIVRFQGLHVSLLTLAHIQNSLQGKNNKKIKIWVERNNKLLKKEFFLKELL